LRGVGAIPEDGGFVVDSECANDDAAGLLPADVQSAGVDAKDDQIRRSVRPSWWSSSRGLPERKTATNAALW
jgi:hypothetical protein